MRIRATLVPVLAIPLALVALAACSSLSTDTGKEPALGPVPTVTDEAGIPTLPLDVYQVHNQQQQTTLEATRVVARACMARYGFDWHGNDPTPQPDLDALTRRRYGLINAGDAARYGYQPPPAGAGNSAGKNSAFNPSPDELAVWRGTVASGTQIGGQAVSAGGCQGEVNGRMEAGAPQGDPNLAQNLSGQSFTKSKTDSRLVAAQAQWSSCMKQAGYDYHNSWEPNGVNWSTRSTAEQVATATADVACRIKTNLVGIWVAVDSAYQHQLVEKNAQQLNLVRQQLDAESRNAAKVLSSG
jgi:hypothetical protein